MAFMLYALRTEYHFCYAVRITRKISLRTATEILLVMSSQEWDEKGLVTGGRRMWWMRERGGRKLEKGRGV